MDLRNDTMKVVYPFANVVTKQADFKAGLKEHVAQTASMHLAKLEGHCVGPYLCGGEIQSADFHMFEMLDQHVAMCEQVTQCATHTHAMALTCRPSPPTHASILTMAILTKAGVVFDVSPFPKLKALHGALRADPALALYFASDMYKRYS